MLVDIYTNYMYETSYIYHRYSTRTIHVNKA